MRRRHQWLLAVLTIAMLSGCAPGFRLAKLSSDQIPVDIRERYEGKDVVWRACYEQGNYTIVWLEETLAQAGGRTVYTFVVNRRDGSGRVVASSGGSIGDAAWPPGYAWSTGRGGGGSGHSIHAAGVAFSRNAHKVVGEMTNGQKVEGLVVNGFWYLRVDEPMGDWVKVVVQDNQGRALHTFERPL